GVVPQVGFVAVGVEDDGAAVELGFQGVGVQFGLLLAFGGAAPGAFGLHHGERATVVVPQHVVDPAAAGGVGHAGDRVFAVVFAVEAPARLFQHQVDEQVAGLRLVVVVPVGAGGVGSLGLGDLGAQPFDFGVERFAAGPLLGEFGVPAGVLLLQLLEFGLLFDPLGGGGGAFDDAGVEDEGVGGQVGGIPGVGAGHPIQHVEQFGRDLHGVRGVHRLAPVHRPVADAPDHVHLPLE